MSRFMRRVVWGCWVESRSSLAVDSGGFHSGRRSWIDSSLATSPVNVFAHVAQAFHRSSVSRRPSGQMQLRILALLCRRGLRAGMLFIVAQHVPAGVAVAPSLASAW